MSELARAIAFEEALRERCAERIVPFAYGRALFNDTYPRVWELNMLRVDDPAGTTVTRLVAEAERLHGSAGHEHRRIAVRDEEAGARLEDGFREHGWQVDPISLHGLPARRVPTPRCPGRGDAAEELRPLREEIAAGEPGPPMRWSYAWFSARGS
jgi:hypothetical protein